MKRHLLLTLLLTVPGCSDDTSPTADLAAGDGPGAMDQAVVAPDAAAGDAFAADTQAAPDGASSDSGPGGCATDNDCPAGKQWCEQGQCVPCDNSGLACDLACAYGWMLYTRNGCHPCACAPPNECVQDSDCSSGDTCYAGAFCWDWCPPGDPSCCQGNVCSGSGCTSPNPAGCVTVGCPMGQSCVQTGCTGTACSCMSGTWGCTKDCGGGVCQ